MLLRVNLRQGDDSRFLGLLHRMRQAELSLDNVQMLNSRVRRSTPADVVTLFSKNEKERKHNAERLDQRKTPLVEYHAGDDCKQLYKEQGVALLAAVTAAQLVVTLSVGAVIVPLSKQYFNVHGLCAGSHGVVVDFHFAYDATLRREERLPVVQFAHRGARGSMRVNILCQNFEAASAQEKCVMAAAVRREIPLQLGWRLSIHNAQSLTLNRVALSLCSVFNCAMVYVAFSRVWHLEDIFLL